MRHPMPPFWLAAFVPFGILLALARTATARTCSTESDCPVGFQCTASDGGQGSSCVSQSCQSNSDCGVGFSCYENIECVPGPDASSIPGNLCVPQWQGQCTMDSDCGDGFHCVISSQACDCSGTGQSVPPDAGAVSEPCAQAGPPSPPCASDAGCPSFPSVCDAGSSCLCWGITRWCQPLQSTSTSCSNAADCLSGWSCSSMTCEPPNSDLAYQGSLGGGMLVCGGSGLPGGLGGSGAPTPGGQPADSGSEASNGPSGSTPPASGSAATTGTKSGGCEIGTGRATGSSWPLPSILLGLAAAAGSLRRRR